MPRFASDELISHRSRYTRRLVLSGEVAALQYRVSRRQEVGEYGACVLKRELFAWLMAGGKRIGAFEINEYDPNGCGSNDQFMFVMDAWEQFEADMSCVLCDQWDDIIIDVTHAGPILDFRSAWIVPEHSSGMLFRKAANALIEAFCPHHSILVMKAYPLEYAGKVPDRSLLRRAVTRRQKTRSFSHAADAERG